MVLLSVYDNNLSSIIFVYSMFFLFMFVLYHKENICIIEEWKSVARNENYLTSRLQGNSSLHLSAEKELALTLI